MHTTTYKAVTAFIIGALVLLPFAFLPSKSVAVTTNDISNWIYVPPVLPTSENDPGSSPYFRNKITGETQPTTWVFFPSVPTDETMTVMSRSYWQKPNPSDPDNPITSLSNNPLSPPVTQSEFTYRILGPVDMGGNRTLRQNRDTGVLELSQPWPNPDVFDVVNWTPDQVKTALGNTAYNNNLLTQEHIAGQAGPDLVFTVLMVAASFVLPIGIPISEGVASFVSESVGDLALNTTLSSTVGEGVSTFKGFIESANIFGADAFYTLAVPNPFLIQSIRDLTGFSNTPPNIGQTSGPGLACYSKANCAGNVYQGVSDINGNCIDSNGNVINQNSAPPDPASGCSNTPITSTVPGVCGNSADKTLSVSPTAGLCEKGNPGVPQERYNCLEYSSSGDSSSCIRYDTHLLGWYWTCDPGKDGVTSQTLCMADFSPTAPPVVPPVTPGQSVPGVCGLQAADLTFSSAPESGLCEKGTPSILSPQYDGTNLLGWTWTCGPTADGVNTPKSCLAIYKPPTPPPTGLCQDPNAGNYGKTLPCAYTGTGGKCGPSANKNFDTAPSLGLCDSGAQSTVKSMTIMGLTAGYSWTCGGSTGPTCTASATMCGGNTVLSYVVGLTGACPPTDGMCSLTNTHYECDKGTSANNLSGPSSWTWECNGLNGGAKATCSESKGGVNTCPNGATDYPTCTAPSLCPNGQPAVNGICSGGGGQYCLNGGVYPACEVCSDGTPVPVDGCSPGNTTTAVSTCPNGKSVGAECQTTGTNVCGTHGYGLIQNDCSCNAVLPSDSSCISVNITSSNGFSITPNPVLYNNTVNLSWDVSGSNPACHLTGVSVSGKSAGNWTGLSAKGTRTSPKMTEDTNFTLSCTNGDTSNSKTILLRVMIPSYKEI